MISENEIEVVRGEGFDHTHVIINIFSMKENKITTDYELKVGDNIYKNGNKYQVERVLKTTDCIYESILEIIR